MMSSFRIPFSGRSHGYTDDELQLVMEVARSAHSLTQGLYRNEFETKFSKFLGSNVSSFAVGSATDGLEIAAQFCQFSHGDEFIIPAHTYTASCYPFIKHGGKPVWADIDSQMRVATVEQIERCITKKTKAIVVVHLYGFATEMAPIIDLASKHGILVIEDCAQAIGCKLGSKRVGTYGDLSIFSFHSHKNITTLGEGGMLCVRDPDLAKLVPLLRHNGHCDFAFPRDDYWIPAMGNVDLPELNGRPMLPNNFCIGEVQCALGSRLLDRVDEISKNKRLRALRFIGNFESSDLIEFHSVESERHNYHLLVGKMLRGDRNTFIRLMAEKYSIQCAVQYYPLNRYDFYEKLGFGEAEIPNTDSFFDNMVSFPFNQTISEHEFEYLLDSTAQAVTEIGGG